MRWAAPGGALPTAMWHNSVCISYTPDKARSEPEASTMRQWRLVRQTLHHTGDQEAFERLRRLSEASDDAVLQ